MSKIRKEFFIIANSFAAPFRSNTSTHFQLGTSPEAAMLAFVEKYDHPTGLYSAVLYESADDYHKGKSSLVRWLCNEAKFMQGKTGLIYKPMRGKVRIDGVLHNIDNPTEGAIVK